jgi:hypothetical protein
MHYIRGYAWGTIYTAIYVYIVFICICTIYAAVHGCAWGLNPKCERARAGNFGDNLAGV